MCLSIVGRFEKKIILFILCKNTKRMHCKTEKTANKKRKRRRRRVEFTNVEIHNKIENSL